MKIKITEEDRINANIELSRSLVGDALLNSNPEIKAKKLYIAHNSIKQTLKMLGIDLQEENKK